MRYTRLRACRMLCLIVALALLVAMLPVGAVLASDPPELNLHRFTGQVIQMPSGDLAPDGTVVSARIGGVEKGSSVVVGGWYGEWDEILDEGTLDVVGQPGDLIHFFVDGQQVTAEPIPWERGGFHHLDLVVFDAPIVVLDPLTPDPTRDNTPTFTGTATSAAVTTVAGVQFRVLGSGAAVVRDWAAAQPVDEEFDSPEEAFTFTIEPALDDGIYTVQARATDALGNTTAPANYGIDTFRIDTTPPVMYEVEALGVGFSTAYIYWKTDEPATSQVEYGTASSDHGDYEFVTGRIDDLVLARNVPLSGLQIDTTYYFRVISMDEAGNEAVSDEFTFKTEAATAPVISDVETDEVTETSAVIWWNTNEPATSRVQYGTSPGEYPYQTEWYTSLVMVHQVVLTGLSPDTTYYFRVRCVNAHDVEAVSDEYSFTTTADETPPVIANLTVDTIRERSAVVRWSTNEGATSRVVYSTTSHAADPGWEQVSDVMTAYGSYTAENPSLLMVHGRSLSGLTAGTDYYFRVIAVDEAGNAAWSEESQFTTDPDETPPVISNIMVPPPLETSARVLWNTNEPATSQVVYGTSSQAGTFDEVADVRAAYDSQTAETGTYLLVHGVSLTGLSPDTKYYYRVISIDAAGNAAWSDEKSFTTAADTTPPVISGVAVPDETLTERRAIIWWNTNEPATSQVVYSKTSHSDDSGWTEADDLRAAYGSFTAKNNALVLMRSMSIAGLDPGTTYYFRVISKDASGNTTWSDEGEFQTKPDTTPPVISGIDVPEGTKTDSRVVVWWNTNEPATSQVVYSSASHEGTDFSGDAAAAARAAYGSFTPKNASLLMMRAVSVTGLAAETTYYFRVISKDAAGNTAISAERSFTTKPDTTPPIIIGVTVTHITDTSAVINWFTNEPATTHLRYDDTSRAAYNDYLYGPDAMNPNLVFRHSALISGLAPDTTYYFRVSSEDAAGNEAISEEFTFTTAADITPPVISNVTTSNIGANMAVIQWLTDEPATSQVVYGTVELADPGWVDFDEVRAAYADHSMESGTLTTSHGIGLAELDANQTYYYRVLSKDGSGNEAWSEEYSFTTEDLTPPALDWGPEVVYVNSSVAVIVWVTDEDSTTEVVYSTASHAGEAYGSGQTDLDQVRADYGDTSGEDATLVMSHGVMLAGLDAGTVYYYRVISKDDGGNVMISEEYSFTTSS